MVADLKQWLIGITKDLDDRGFAVLEKLGMVTPLFRGGVMNLAAPYQ